MKKKTKEKIAQDTEFQSILQEFIKNEAIQKLKEYRQHFKTNRFEHCYLVSYYCYRICKKLKLDYRSATRAAMLHDFFLYDWRTQKSGREKPHAFTHGKIACENASKIFELNEKEKDMIIKHMWPVTLSFPKSPEGFILTFVDKYCATIECFQ